MFGLFSLRSQSVKQATTLLAITALLSNGLGLVRNLIFYRFIAPAQLDVYFASFRIADFILNLLIMGAVTSAVIPVLAELIAHKKDTEAKTVTNQLFTWASVAVLLLIAILAIAMPWLVERLFGGFDHARLESTIFFSRILLVQALFFSWSLIIGALLNGYRRFTSYALAPLVYNCILIAGGLLAGSYGLDILVWLVVVGSAGHFLVQLNEARRLGFLPQLDFHISSEIRQVVRLMIPRSLSQGMNQIVLLIYTSLAAGLQAGSIAIFSGMNDLQTAPTVIIANSLAAASFPAIAAHVASKQFEELNALLSKIVRSSFFLLIPILVLSLVLRAQIVRLYFGLGTANWELTGIAITTFTYFIIGIIPFSLVAILARVFYATKDTRTPMLITFFSSLIGITVSIIGIKHYGATVATLALSETLIGTSQCLLFFYILHKRAHLSLSFKVFGRTITNAIIGSILLGIASWGTLYMVDIIYEYLPGIFSTDRIIGLFIQMLLAATVGILVYFGYSSIRSKEELQWLKQKSFLKNR